jgi:hypothetical protein
MFQHNQTLNLLRPFLALVRQTCPTEARQAVQAVRRTRVHPRMIIHLRRRSTPTLQVITRNYQSS